MFVFVWYALRCVLSSNGSKRKRELVAFLRMSWYCIYSVALPYGA